MNHTFFSDTQTKSIPEKPRHSGQFFTWNEATFATVYQMAGSLLATVTELQPRPPAICLATENRAVIAAALLAALCGGPGLLLPPSLSVGALADMQQQTGFQVAISDTPDSLPPATTRLWPRPDRSASLHFNSSPDDIIVHLFTGGSTGQPTIWPKNVANLLLEARYLVTTLSITNQDAIVATISPIHIYGLLFSVLVPLVSSATIHPGSPLFPAEIETALQQTGATILAAVPAHYRVLRNRQLSRSNLRLAVSSAGMLDPADNTAFYQQNKVPVIEVYGSTENGGIATRNRMAGETAFTPFAPIDWQTDGERLLVKSPFISPNAQLNEAGFFRTGDRVEALTNTTFLLQGRVDGIIKVGGKRVDLEKIREVIKEQDGIQDCFVLTKTTDDGRGNHIQALVQGNDLDLNGLFAALQSILDPWALPRTIRQTTAIPMTGAGKYNLHAIRKLLEQ